MRRYSPPFGILLLERSPQPNKTELKEMIIMKRVMLFSLACMISLAMQPFPASGTAALPAQVSQASNLVGRQGELRASYGALPLSFELNQGQTDGAVDFLARAGGYLLFLTPTEAVMDFDN